MKRIKCFLVLCVLSILLSSPVDAKPSKKTVKKAYKAYISTKLSSSNYLRPFVKYYDINGDGIQECFFVFEQGPRYGARIFTYKGGKVYSVLSDGRGLSSIYYKKGSKKIAILFSSGAANNTLVVYKLAGKKLKISVQYHDYGDYSTGKAWYYKNGKPISKKKYVKATTPYLYWKTIQNI